MEEIATVIASVFILIVSLCAASQLGTISQDLARQHQEEQWEQEKQLLLLEIDFRQGE